jgi:hypothetical protein
MTVSVLGAAKIEERRGAENPSDEHPVATANRFLSRVTYATRV